MENRGGNTKKNKDFFNSKEVSVIFNCAKATINKYCNSGLLEGAVFDTQWFVPKDTVKKEELKKRLVSKYYCTVPQLAKTLGISAQPINSLIKANLIKTKSFTLLRRTKAYILKSSVATYIEQKKNIDSGKFISRIAAAKVFGYADFQIKYLEKDLKENDKFMFFGITYCKLESLKLIIDSKDLYVTVKEAASKLGRDTSTVAEWCNKGKLPGAYIVNGAWAIPNEVFEIVLKERRFKEDTLKKYMAMSEFCKLVGQSYKVVSTRITNGFISDFVKIEGEWFIPTDKVKYYEDNLEWLKRRSTPIKNSEEYYSKDNMIKEFNYRIEEISDQYLPEFTRLFLNYGKDVIGKTRTKGYKLKAYVTDHVNVYERIILLFQKDFGEGVDDEIENVLRKTSAPNRLKISFNTFLNYAFSLEGIKRKKGFSVRVVKLDDEDLEPYSPETYQEINLFAREIDEHIPRAVKSASYAQMWVYVILHLTDVWRHSDLVEKLPPVTLEQLGVMQLNWFKENKLSLEKCQKIINELYMKLSSEQTNKTSARMTFLVEPTLIECLGHALVISEIHRRKKSNEAKLLFTFFNRNIVISTVSKGHLTFFDRKPELKVFRNQKMNRSTMTYFHYSIVEEDTDNADVALAFTQQLRSHRKSETTGIYVKIMNKDGSVNRVASTLFKRGHFGWLYNYMILAAIEGTGIVQSLEERTQTIELLKNDLNVKDLEDWAGFFYTNELNNKQHIIQKLSKMTKEELIVLIKRIFNQEMPAKTMPGQCMVYPNCEFSGRNNCFGCHYFIPQYYVLIEAAKEFKRLIKSMIEAKYETTFTRDKKWLLTTMTIIQEAKAIYSSEIVNSFIAPSEIRKGLESVRAKKIIE